MVLLNGNKYACETCIKGHRSSTCRHTDRPLFEIKKKGRPITQCDHCRELRKTKQVHIKCMCEAKEEHPVNQSSGTKKGHTKIPDCATFPLGLPEALGASVAPPTSTGASSDSDHGGMTSNCSCKTGGECNCWTPRKSAPKHRKKDVTVTPHVDSESQNVPSSSGSRTPSHILARLAELRPVLPRPSHGLSNGGPSHDPSSSVANGHPVRRLSHENLHYSPYGRAYDKTHEQLEQFDDAPIEDQRSQNDLVMPTTPGFPIDEQIFRDQLRALEAAADWVPPAGSEAAISLPSTCGCGDNCHCPGCVQHNPDTTPASSAFSSCSNPATCSRCLDCTILSLPASLPPDTSLSIYDVSQTQSIDEWIRQVSSLPRTSPGSVTPPPPNAGITGVTVLTLDEQQPPWDGYLTPITEPLPPENIGYVVQPCCGVLCKCSPEQCECDLESENGYDCRKEMLIPAFGERSYSPSQHPATNGDPMLLGTLDAAPGNGIYIDTAAEQASYLAIPDSPRSRSSSTSSSQSRSSRGPASQNPFTTQPLSLDYSFPGQPLGRVRAPFYTGPSSFSSPNLGGLRLQTDLHAPLSGGSSPASVSPARSVQATGTYAVSNPDVDGYVSADGGNSHRR
ncbi:putative ace1 transcription factor [Lyophyllum shimeji]|uniref:Ace1 transcription factor n=1 Tax=Lyophyllum shimeji TaxID=47721 RepID=A0A9P3PRE5_LYOSH|nr:putative ace1 transcription factor [Lyophyllum shimeji]